MRQSGMFAAPTTMIQRRKTTTGHEVLGSERPAIDTQKSDRHAEDGVRQIISGGN